MVSSSKGRWQMVKYILCLVVCLIASVAMAQTTNTGDMLNVDQVISGNKTFTGQMLFSSGGELMGIQVLGSQGGGGAVGYVLFGTGSFTQNTIPRWDSSGSPIDSFLTDSGAILTYNGVNGYAGTQFVSTCGSPPCAGIFATPITLAPPGNGGSVQWGADPVSGLAVVNINGNGSTYTAGDGPIIFQSALTAAVTTTVAVPASFVNSTSGASLWHVDVYMNEVSSIAGCAGTGTAAVTITYTDTGGTGTQVFPTLTFASSGHPQSVGSGFFRVSTSSNINYSISYSGGSGCKYDATLVFSRKQ